MDYAEKMQRCHGYVEALEEERRKIQVFQRELPLCLELVTQAIEACKRELSGTTTEYMQGQSEWSEEQTSSDGPVLEEFIPIKRSHSSDSDNENEDNENDHDEQQYSHRRNKSNDNHDNNNNTNNGSNNNKEKISDHNKKSDWLRSVQLWNHSPDPLPHEEVPRKAVVTEVKRNGGAFQPFKKQKSSNGKNNNQTTAKVASPAPPTAASSTVETVTKGGSSGGGSSGKKEEKEGGQLQRKQRRCWSPELHRRFLNALQQLGGSHVATPKQIRELMKVDGLSNDEVKSHLQKYRLHTRRPSPAMHNNNGNPQAPQFVVVGGIWVPPPPEYTAVATTTSGKTATIVAANGIYAPIAAPPPPPFTQASTSSVQKDQHEQLHSEGRGSHSEGGVHSNSPSTSSSTHTTTNSPPLSMKD